MIALLNDVILAILFMDSLTNFLISFFKQWWIDGPSGAGLYVVMTAPGTL